MTAPSTRSPRRRLTLYAASLLGLLLGAELLARLEAPVFEAVSHRVRFKLALLDRQGPLELLFVGTSRFNDGLATKLISSRLEGDGSAGPWRGFNASVSLSSLQTLEYLVHHGQGHPGLRAVILELSERQLHEGELDFEDTGAARPPGSRLLEYRRALVFDNLPRFLCLMAARSCDGSEWFRSRWLVESFRGAPVAPDGPMEARFQPRIWSGDEGGPVPLPSRLDKAARVYVQLAAELERSSLRAFLVVPPISSALKREECAPDLQALYAEIARRTHRPVWDYSCADVPDRLFVDTGHLGGVGRAYFSRSLATQLSQALHPGGPRSLPALQ